MTLKDVKGIKHLSKFSKKELKSFQLFIASPYHNRNNDLSLLLNILIKHHPTFRHKNCTYEYISKRLTENDKKLSIANLNKMIHQLYQAMIKFQAVDSLVSDKKEIISKALSSIHKNPQYNNLPLLTNEHLKLLERQKYMLVDDYLSLAKNYKHLYNLSLEKDNQGKHSYLIAFKENLDKHFFLEKLEFHCAILARTNILLDKEILWEEELNLKSRAIIDEEKEPIFNLYIKIIELFTDFNPSTYHLIKDQLFKKYEYLSESQLKNVLTMLQNYTFLRVREGEAEFTKELFLLQKFSLATNKSEMFSSSKFLNIVVSACIAKETTFAEEFIEKGKSRIEGEDQTDTFNLSKAFLYFHRENFDESYKHLLKIDSKKIHFSLRVRTLTIRCLYEFYLKEDSYETTLRSRVVALERYCNRDLIITENYVQAYLNFAQIIRFMISKSAKNDLNKYRTLTLEQIDKMDQIIAKEWLLKKIKEL